MNRDPDAATATDALTTLYTKSVFLAALEKEIHRSDRFGHPFGLILMEVDRLAEINATFGDGVGDRVLERMGIGVRSYFRETDWVARTSGGTFAVLLTETPRATAERLAEGVRAMIEHRLQFEDHESGQQFPVTVSVGLVIAQSMDRNIGADSLLAEARAAVERAKQQGRNRVEQVDARTSRSAPPRAGASMA